LDELQKKQKKKKKKKKKNNKRKNMRYGVGTAGCIDLGLLTEKLGKNTSGSWKKRCRTRYGD